MIRALSLFLTLFASLAHAAPVRLCVIGDSISEGFAPATRGWSSYLVADKAGTDFSAKNVAQSGDKVAAAQAVFDLELAGPTMRGCTWVAIMIGTNDLPDGTSAATIYAAIDAMMEEAESNGANTIGLAVTPRGTGAFWSSDLQTRLETLNTFLAGRSSSTAGRRYVFVDTYTALLEPESDPPELAAAAGGATDGLHPNNAGQQMIADAVEAAVVAAGGW